MLRRRPERSPRPEARETGRCAAARARRSCHAVLLAITCSEEAADALPSWRWQSDPGLPLIVASSLEDVSSDWVAVEVIAVAVVLSESACGREIAAYDRLGRELIRRAWLRGLDTPRRGRRQGRSWRGGHTRPLGKGLCCAFLVTYGLCWRPLARIRASDCAHRKRLILRGALAGGDRGVVVLMKLVGRTRGLADRGGRREGRVLRGLRAGTRNVSAGARARWSGCGLRVAGGDVSVWWCAL
jgi:hypothetical protein